MAASSTIAARAKFSTDAARAHQLEARLVHQAARGVDQRHVHGDHVAAREQVVEAQRLLDARRQLPGALHRDLRIVAEHLHAQAERRVGHLDADRAEADDAERAARQLVADELLLALLDRLLDGVVVALESAHVAPRLADVARRQEQPRQHQFLDRVGVGARRVEHRHAAATQLRDRHVVGARTRRAPRPARSPGCPSRACPPSAAGSRPGGRSRRPLRSDPAAAARGRGTEMLLRVRILKDIGDRGWGIGDSRRVGGR